MKKRRLLASMVTAILCSSMLLTLPVYAEPTVSATNAEKEIIFSNSFEDTEVNGFLESTVSEKGTSNITSLINIQHLTGDVTRFVDLNSVQGSSDNGTGESKVKIFDQNSGSKWLTRDAMPIWVSFSLKEAKVIKTYQITSANDASERDPKAWEFLGSNDGTNWTLLDKQENQSWDKRLQSKEYSLANNNTAYTSYKLVVSSNKGNSSMTQFADINLATGNPDDDEKQEEFDYMKSSLSTGPTVSYNQQTGVGWSGAKALSIAGEQTANGEAYSYNDIFDVNIPVKSNTHLSYVIFPALVGDYDYTYASMHTAIDLKFTDGSYLSDLNVLDDNGNIVSAYEQGESRTLTVSQWNKISANIGTYAQGKTIDKIVVAYHDKDQTTDKPFSTFFDDIEISNYDEVVHDRKSDYVSILRGTNDSPSFSRGLTAPAVTTPHGFNFWAPVTNSNSNKLYDYQQNNGKKFQHVTVSHEPSYWVGDRGTWQFMVNSNINIDNVTTANQISSSSVASTFSHDNEEAKAHYYKVGFDEGTPANGTTLEVTPSEHGAISRFTFDDTAENHNVIFDSVRAAGKITIDNNGKSFSGYTDHTSNGMTRMYVYGTFSEPISSSKVLNDKQAIVNFASDVSSVEMTVATSFISEDQAKKSISLEIGKKDFDDLKEETQTTWDKQLDTIEVEGASATQLTTLYSNMYRLFAYPNNYAENTGTNVNPVWKYSSPYGNGVTEGKLYSNNGFWDTYRTTWSAYSLLSPTKYNEMLNGLVQHYDDNTWVPRWIAPGGTNSMVGTSSDIIFADAALKGADFDQFNAYKAALKNGSVVSQNLTGGGRAQLGVSNFVGYVPSEKDSFGFSWSMEGYINDYGIARMAEQFGHEDEKEYFYNRALNYQQLFDKRDTTANSWFKGKQTSGDWSWTDENFDPISWAHDYTETDAYNMSVSVPFDGQGLVNLYGSEEALAEKIDSILNATGEWTGGNIHEMHEAREIKLGQYGHSNQPSHHILYMYNYAGQPWKTQKYVRDILKRAYVGGDFGQGYIGDEDNGEMSAWQILSSLGFYPLNVGSNEYAIGSPLYKKATVHLEDGKDLVINAPNNSDENIYVQSVKVNGETHTKNTFTHEQLTSGATIDFEMGSEPNTSWGSNKEDLPTSLSNTLEDSTVKTDMTNSNITVTTQEKDSFQDQLITNISDAKNLVDNTASTAVSIKNQSLVYKFKKAQTASMYTLTSATNSAGQSFDNITLSGSNDGVNWQTLDSRDNVDFEWSQYTRPFAIPQENRVDYRYFKLDFNGSGSISEIEFLGHLNSTVTKEDLAKAIELAKAVDQTDFNESFKRSFADAIAQAEEILNNPASTPEDYEKGLAILERIMAAINNKRDAYQRIEAETYDSGNVVNDGNNIGGVKVGYYAAYNTVDFQYQDPNYFEINYAGQNKDTCADATVEVYTDSLDGEPVFSIATPPTAENNWSNYQTVSTQLTPEQSAKLQGIHDVYLKFVGTGKAYVCNVDWFRFATKLQVNTTVSEGGSVNNLGPVTTEYGQNIEYTLSPQDGYVPDYVEINGIKTVLNASATSFTLSDIKQDTNVLFSFKVKAQEDIPVESIKINSAALTVIKKNQTLALAANILPENATDKSVSWESQNPNIASVNAQGVVTGVSTGITRITVTASNGVKSTIAIRITS